MNKKKCTYFIFLNLACIIHASRKPSTIPIGKKTGHYFSRPHDPKKSDTINTLVMHYTVSDLNKTFKIFLSNNTRVSAHYIINTNGTIFSNIDEDLAARHAGAGNNSYWQGKNDINTNSLGIEHVNPGYKVNESQPTGIIIPGSDKEWYPFRSEEIHASIQLAQYLIKKYNIKPENVVGHSDIAPRRKHDPGPLFPWKQFAQHGIGAWPDKAYSHLPCLEKAIRNNKLKQWLITHLHIWGYKLPDEQANAQDIIRAFQMHFRQSNISGDADQETAQVLSNLLCTYKGKDCKCKRDIY